jgi:hypothetical protein
MGIGIRECGGVEVWKCRCAAVRQCGCVEVWKCGGVEVRRCGGAEVWRCGLPRSVNFRNEVEEIFYFRGAAVQDKPNMNT